MPEPDHERLGGCQPLRVIRRYLLATRPRFLSASALAVLVGSSWGSRQAGALDPAALLLALLGVCLLHAAVNVLNDVCDDRNGTDSANQERIYPYTGGSRFIQNGILSAAQMRNWALLLLLAALIPGVLLVLLKGLPVLLLGLAGAALGIAYSLPPIQLASRGLGELAVALGFGVLPVTAAAWLQAGSWDPAAWLLSLAVSAWVANILLINEVPDARADAAAGKRTLVVRLGIPAVRRLYALLSLAAPLALLPALSHGLSPWALVLPALLPLPGLRAARRIGSPALKPAIEQTLAMHGLGCLWLAAMLWY